jgi:hypothetical protein
MKRNEKRKEKGTDFHLKLISVPINWATQSPQELAYLECIIRPAKSEMSQII